MRDSLLVINVRGSFVNLQFSSKNFLYVRVTGRLTLSLCVVTFTLYYTAFSIDDYDDNDDDDGDADDDGDYDDEDDHRTVSL